MAPVYAVIMTGAIVATLLLVTPVALHRVLFHRGERLWLVKAADRYARWGLATMALTILGVVWFILDAATATWIAPIIAVVLAAFLIIVWIVVPSFERRTER